MSNVAIDWNRYMNGLLGKANIAADNFSFPGKEELSGMGMPSDKCTDLSLGVDGSKYSAPANGYFAIELKTNGHIFVLIDDGLYTQSAQGSGVLTNASVLIPVKAGRQIQVYHSGDVQFFKFIYAEGSKN